MIDQHSSIFCAKYSVSSKNYLFIVHNLTSQHWVLFLQIVASCKSSVCRNRKYIVIIQQCMIHMLLYKLIVWLRLETFPIRTKIAFDWQGIKWFFSWKAKPPAVNYKIPKQSDLPLKEVIKWNKNNNNHLSMQPGGTIRH